MVCIQDGGMLHLSHTRLPMVICTQDEKIKTFYLSTVLDQTLLWVKRREGMLPPGTRLGRPVQIRNLVVAVVAERKRKE